MANTFIAPTQYSVDRVNKFLDGFVDSAYYLFAADHRPTTNTDISVLSQAASNNFYEPWQQMILGKRVTQFAPGIPNLPYENGVVYSEWDDLVDMTGLQWYAIVNAGSWFHVFECLYNNGNSASTVQPDFTQASATGSFLYQTSDGYRWMYVASTDSTTVANLATADWFPLVANVSVAGGAVPGAIPVVEVMNSGKLYDNYTAGTFQSSDVRVGASPVTYQLSNSGISTVDGFYTGCVLLITGGTGTGQFSTVVDYQSTNTGNYATLSGPFAITPTNGSTWEAYPGVVLESDGTELTPAVARALVNAASSNSVGSVEVLYPGSGYFSPTTARVVANAVVGVTNANRAFVRPIMPPHGGYGFDQASELGATVALVSCFVANSESGHVPATNSYRTIGLLKNPSFANVQLTLSGSFGTFTSGEGVAVLDLTWAANGVSTNSASNTLTLDTRMLTVGAQVYVTNGSVQYLANVAAVTNSSSASLTTVPPFTSSNAQVFLANTVATGQCLSPVSSANVYVSYVMPFGAGNTLFGLSSGASGLVSSIARNDVIKNFDTFVQLYKYRVTLLGGAFQANEVAVQDGESALVHSYANGFLYVSNMTGAFSITGNNVVGNTSGATATVTVAYGPELVPGWGTMEYVENVAQINRANNQTESFVVVYPF